MSEKKATARPKLSAELFMPPEGGIEEQIERQIAFMTQGVMENMLLAAAVLTTAGSVGATRTPAPPSVATLQALLISRATAGNPALHARAAGAHNVAGSAATPCGGTFPSWGEPVTPPQASTWRPVHTAANWLRLDSIAGSRRHWPVAGVTAAPPADGA